MTSAPVLTFNIEGSTLSTALFPISSVTRVVVSAALASVLCFSPAFCFDQSAVDKLVNPLLAEQAASLEIVTVNGILSHVEYVQPARTSPSLTSPLPRMIFEKPVLVPYGSVVQSGLNRFSRSGPGPGGLLLELAEPGGVRDLLSYDTVTLAGIFSGQWNIALADENLAALEENRVLGPSAAQPPRTPCSHTHWRSTSRGRVFW